MDFFLILELFGSSVGCSSSGSSSGSNISSSSGRINISISISIIIKQTQEPYWPIYVHISMKGVQSS